MSRVHFTAIFRHATAPNTQHPTPMHFAILTHDHPFLHWDLLLEAGPMCRTWRLQTSPEHDGLIFAEAIPDHRLLYLDYEGPVSGDRGSVSRWDGGHLVWLTATESNVEILVCGTRWQGRVSLRRDVNSPQWMLQR